MGAQPDAEPLEIMRGSAPSSYTASGGSVRPRACATRPWSDLGVSLRLVSVSLKYAVVERERRYLLSKMPEGATSRKEIVDRYVNGTRLRLREVREGDGTVVRKLGHKVRLTEGPREVACTNAYLNEEEWAVLSTLPGRTLRKTRHLIPWGQRLVAVDVHEDGALVAEIDDRDEPSDSLPDWLDVVRDVTDDENWTGSRLAR